MILAIAIASSVVAVGLGAFSAALIITNDKLQKRVLNQENRLNFQSQSCRVYEDVNSKLWDSNTRYKTALEDIVDMATPNMANIGKRMSDVAVEALDG